MIGFTHGGPTRDRDRPGAGEVYALYVAREHARRGHGAALLRAKVDDLRADGFSPLVLWVLRDNARARAFYESQGWAFDGTEQASRWGAAEVRYHLTGAPSPEAAPSAPGGWSRSPASLEARLRLARRFGRERSQGV